MNSGYKLIKSYIRSRRLAILAITLLVFSMVAVFAIYGFWHEVLFAWLGLASVLIAIFIVFDFTSFAKLNHTIHKLSLGQIVEIHSYNYLDNANCQLIEIINERQKRSSEISSAHEMRYQTLQDDYTKWVHQIKTPIAALRLLLEREQSSDNTLMKAELFKIERYVDMALEMIRLENKSNDLHIEELSLNGIVSEIAKKYKSLFIEKGIGLVLPESDLKVISDKKWLGLAIEQLISNSLKYTKKGEINLFYTNNQLIINDQGIGILPEDLPRIFERGYTGYNVRGFGKSTGIGLNLTKRTLDMLGHHIKIQSEVDQGTEVIITFK